MNTSPTIGALAAALAKAQAAFAPVVKDRENPFFHSKYATLSSILDATRPALAAHGLAVVQRSSALSDRAIVRRLDKDKKLVEVETIIVTVSTMIAHSSGEWIIDELRILSDGANPQAVGSAISYARRYGLAAMLCVAADEEDDGEAAQGRPAPAKPKPEPKPKSDPKPQTGGAASDGQRKRLFAACKGAGYTEADIRTAVSTLFPGTTSTRDLTAAQIDTLVALAEARELTGRSDVSDGALTEEEERVLAAARDRTAAQRTTGPTPVGDALPPEWSQPRG
jgi:hypothetical protein